MRAKFLDKVGENVKMSFFLELFSSLLTCSAPFRNCRSVTEQHTACHFHDKWNNIIQNPNFHADQKFK